MSDLGDIAVSKTFNRIQVDTNQNLNMKFSDLFQNTVIFQKFKIFHEEFKMYPKRNQDCRDCVASVHICT